MILHRGRFAQNITIMNCFLVPVLVGKPSCVVVHKYHVWLKLWKEELRIDINDFVYEVTFNSKSSDIYNLTYKLESCIFKKYNSHT